MVLKVSLSSPQLSPQQPSAIFTSPALNRQSLTTHQLLVAFECVYCTGVGLVKLSLLLMYARIFPLKGFRIGAYILGFITVGWVIAINCVSIFQCHPIKKAWFPTMPGECIDLKGSFIGNAVPNILTDVAILCMPVAQVWKLQVTTAQRASLIFMFLLGGLLVETPHPQLPQPSVQPRHHPSSLPHIYFLFRTNPSSLASYSPVYTALRLSCNSNRSTRPVSAKSRKNSPNHTSLMHDILPTQILPVPPNHHSHSPNPPAGKPSTPPRENSHPPSPTFPGENLQNHPASTNPH